VTRTPDPPLRRRPLSSAELRGQVVSVDGFEPPISCFQGRQGRPGSPTRWIGAHGRTRTCTLLVRNQELYPVELRVRDWRRDGDSNSGLPAENRHVLATRRARQTGSPTWTRTWIDRLTAGRPAVGRSGNGGAPRTRTELNLLAREIRGPCACPDWSCHRGPDPCSACTDQWRDGLTPTDRLVPGVGFESTSPRLQLGVFTRLASPAELNVVRPTGIEPVSARWHRAALPLSYGRPSFQHNGAQSRTRTCEARRHLIYSQASLPLEYLCAMDGAGNRKDRPYLLLAEG
jgi:hypothetical protein